MTQDEKKSTESHLVEQTVSSALPPKFIVEEANISELNTPKRYNDQVKIIGYKEKIPSQDNATSVCDNKSSFSDMNLLNGPNIMNNKNDVYIETPTTSRDLKNSDDLNFVKNKKLFTESDDISSSEDSELSEFCHPKSREKIAQKETIPQRDDFRHFAPHPKISDLSTKNRPPINVTDKDTKVKCCMSKIDQSSDSETTETARNFEEGGKFKETQSRGRKFYKFNDKDISELPAIVINMPSRGEDGEGRSTTLNIKLDRNKSWRKIGWFFLFVFSITCGVITYKSF